MSIIKISISHLERRTHRALRISDSHGFERVVLPAEAITLELEDGDEFLVTDFIPQREEIQAELLQRVKNGETPGTVTDPDQMGLRLDPENQPAPGSTAPVGAAITDPETPPAPGSTAPVGAAITDPGAPLPPFAIALEEKDPDQVLEPTDPAGAGPKGGENG